jgi:hypothetical protein
MQPKERCGSCSGTQTRVLVPGQATLAAQGSDKVSDGSHRRPVAAAGKVEVAPRVLVVVV